MNWSDKAKEIAEQICSVETLNKKDFASEIIYNEDGTLDIEHIRQVLLPFLEEAAIKGMEYELNLWMNRPRKTDSNTEETN